MSNISERCTLLHKLFQIVEPLYNGLFRYFSVHLVGILKIIFSAARVSLGACFINQDYNNFNK